MIFSRKRTDEPHPARPSAPTATPPEPVLTPDAQISLLLDTIGSIIKAYARGAIDTDVRAADDAKHETLAWLRHATIGTPPPDAPEAVAVGISHRDWRGLVQYVSDDRRNEHDYATRALRDLRDTVWAFVSSAHQIVTDETEADQLASAQLQRVRDAIESSSTERLKREALAAVELMSSISERRRERQRQQFTALSDRLKALGTELEEARRDGSLDTLTQLANRKGFDNYVTRSIELHALSAQPACLLLVDVDHLKLINDGFGHAAGDAALKLVAGCLSRVFLRRCDFVCRYGGDEFAVILYETELASAGALASRFLDAIAELRLPDRGDSVRLAVSVGVAELQNGENADGWMHRADAALYIAKQTGRGRFVEA